MPKVLSLLSPAAGARTRPALKPPSKLGLHRSKQKGGNIRFGRHLSLQGWDSGGEGRGGKKITEKGPWKMKAGEKVGQCSKFTRAIRMEKSFDQEAKVKDGGWQIGGWWWCWGAVWGRESRGANKGQRAAALIEKPRILLQRLLQEVSHSLFRLAVKIDFTSEN